jgi:hypothetical protein
MPPNALYIRALKNERGIRGHHKAWGWSHGGPITSYEWAGSINLFTVRFALSKTATGLVHYSGSN